MSAPTRAVRRAAAPTLEEIRAWPATVDVPRGADALGVSRSHAYELAKRGEFPARTIQVGGRIRVITASLIRLLEGGAA